MKDKYTHFALIGLGAVIVLWILIKQMQAQKTAGPAIVESAPGAAPAYPNSQPLKMGDIEIGGSPINITYNTGTGGFDPDSRVELQPGANSATPGGSCSCEDDPCAQIPGTPVTVQKVPAKVYQVAVDNFSGFVSKAALPAHNSPMAGGGSSSGAKGSASVGAPVVSSKGAA